MHYLQSLQNQQNAGEFMLAPTPISTHLAGAPVRFLELNFLMLSFNLHMFSAIVMI